MNYEEARKHLDALATALSFAYSHADDRAELQSENHVLRGERDRLQRELDELRGTDNLRVAGELNLHQRIDALEAALAKVHLYPEHEKAHQAIHQRIDKVVEIIGERVEGLVNDIAVATDSAKRAHERLAEHDHKLVLLTDIAGTSADSKAWLVDKVAVATDSAKRAHERLDRLAALTDLSSDGSAIRKIAAAVSVREPAFPTGGASTAEAAAEAVLPMPQRGDRVRLEGARSTGGTTLTGWYDVLGRYEPNVVNLGQFQVGNAQSMGMYWVYDTDPGLKEVRHAQ